jgi:hypothetical protein
VHGPSCWLLTYFFVDLMVTVLLTYFIAYTLGHGYGHNAFAFRSQNAVFSILGLEPKQIDKLVVLTRDEFETIETLFQIKA